MRWKHCRLLSVYSSLVLLLLCLVKSSIENVKAEEIFGNDTVVTFGLYSAETGQIETSQPDYFFDHIRYGMSHSIYNYFKRIYGDNANFPSEVSIFYQRLLDYFGTDFFQTLAEQRWLCNVVIDTYQPSAYLFFQRVPDFSFGCLMEKEFKLNETFTIELLPQGFGSSFYIWDNRGIGSICPYFYKEDVPVGDQYSTLVATGSKYTNLEDVKQSLTNSNIRCFALRLMLSVPSLTFTVSYSNDQRYCAYYNASTLKGFSYPRNYNGQFISVMTDFPYYVGTDDYSNPLIGNYSSTDCRVYYNRFGNELNRDNVNSGIIISGYNDIPPVTPTPTHTPTPIPTWTPYPTATPFPPVNEIEGIGQMMTLFTRKYEFNINGNVIGIRPLYLFVFTFLVGAIFKAVQGGDRN